MKLKLKDKYKNSIIKRGKYILDTNKVSENAYFSYYITAFEDVFDVIEENEPKNNLFQPKAKKIIDYKGIPPIDSREVDNGDTQINEYYKNYEQKKGK